MKELSFQSVVQDNMRIDWNVPITMEDGLIFFARMMMGNIPRL